MLIFIICCHIASSLILKNLLALYLACRWFTHTEIVTCYGTAGLDIPYLSTDFGRHTFSCSSRTTWNSIPTSIKNCSSPYSFKRYLKSQSYPSTGHLTTVCASDSCARYKLSSSYYYGSCSFYILVGCYAWWHQLHIFCTGAALPKNNDTAAAYHCKCRNSVATQLTLRHVQFL